MGSSVRQPLEYLGPRFLDIHLDEPSALVFLDEEPDGNFGHACRYLLYDPDSGKYRRRMRARYPPYEDVYPPDFAQYYGPTPFSSSVPPLQSFERLAKPADAKRYAILFCGRPYERHLNELELSYRMLTQTYGLAAANIQVAYHNGALDIIDGSVPPTWPGDSTAYTLQPTAAGTVAGFRAALSSLGALSAGDKLFIHVTGDGDEIGEDAYVAAADAAYTATQMGTDLQTLVAHANGTALLVLMQQCCAGGFNEAVINGWGTGARASIASATGPDGVSHYTKRTPHWNYFSSRLIAAHTGQDVITGKKATVTTQEGAPVPRPLSADDAFAFAQSHDPADEPEQQDEKGGGAITLA